MYYQFAVVWRNQCILTQLLADSYVEIIHLPMCMYPTDRNTQDAVIDRRINNVFSHKEKIISKWQICWLQICHVGVLTQLLLTHIMCYV